MGKKAETNEITLDTAVTTKELAVVLGLSTRRIQQLVQDGQFEAVTRGRYNLAKCVERYFAMMSKNETDEEREKAQADLSIRKAKAIIAVSEARELQGKLHRSEDVAEITEDLVFTIRGMLLALPGRLAVDVSAVSDPAEAAELIRQEVFDIMNELVNYRYDPRKYEDKVRERRRWDVLEDDEDDL